VLEKKLKRKRVEQWGMREFYRARSRGSLNPGGQMEPTDPCAEASEEHHSSSPALDLRTALRCAII
jgi:hypothetical protein